MKSLAGKIALALLIPVLLLGTLELAFRVLDVGYPTSFLVEGEVDGEPVWVENPFFTYHVFPPPLARTPAQIVAKKIKPDGVFRAVVLGESAAQGDPIPDFGPPRVLEYVLRHYDPSARVEVINAAITAINSHIIREIARDLPKLQPDLVILYIGNNEVIGPYGPGTVFTGFVNRDAVIRLSLWANRLRVTQALRLTLAMISDRRQTRDFGGVAMFMDNPVPFDDPRLNAVRRRFEQNIKAIIRDAHAAGAEVLISTVAVNIEGCPPSLSTHRKSLDETSRMRWQSHFDQGWTMAKIKAWPEAIRQFSSALAIDDAHAELHYWLGVCFRESGRADEAAAAFTRAMELDAFRYRADSSLNEILRRVAAETRPSAHLVDTAALFRDQSDDGDADLFVDHVHFSFAGASLLTRLWAAAIFKMKTWPTLTDRDGVPDTDWLKEQLMFTQVAEISVLQEMVRRFGKPPFNLQPDIAGRVENHARRIRELTDGLRASGGDAIPDMFRARMQAHPDDLHLPMHLAQYLVSRHRYTEAAAVAEQVMKRYPHRRGPRATAAHISALMGQPEAAAETLFGFQSKHGFFAAGSASYVFGLSWPGVMLTRPSPPAGPCFPGFGLPISAGEFTMSSIASRLFKSGWDRRGGISRQDARRRRRGTLRKLTDERPDLGEPKFLLAVAMQDQGEAADAFQTVQHALENMNFARAYYHAGLWQLCHGSVAQGVDFINRSVALAHDDWRLVNSLAWLLLAGPWDELRNRDRALELLDGLARRTGTPPPIILETRMAAMEAIEQKKPVTWTESNRPMNLFLKVVPGAKSDSPSDRD